MPTIPRLRTTVLLVFLVLAPAACAAAPCTAVVSEGWVRMGPAAMPMMAGFGRIRNACAAPLVIVGASSPAFDSVQVHETRTVDGISRMRAVPELRVAPDGEVAFKPGGLHLMLMQPHAPLKAGSKVAIEFQLAGGGVLRGEFEVRKPAN